jgi:hypothetical protein
MLLLETKQSGRIVAIERGSTRSHAVENSLWKRLRTCFKTGYRMNTLSFSMPSVAIFSAVFKHLFND